MTKGQAIRRAPGVLSQRVGDEWVIVNPETQQAHALAGPLAAAWVATETGQPADPDAIAQLVGAGLLIEPAGLTRRAVLARGGLVAAGVGIVSVGLPMVNASASGQSITRTPTSGHVGSTVSVSGTLFPASSGVVITFDGVTMTTTPASPVTNGVGTFTNVQFTVPAAVAGVHTIAAIAGGQSATTTYTVTPEVTSAPASLPRNGGGVAKTVTLTGTGFAATSSTAITRGGDFTAGAGGPFTTNATGGFSGNVTGILYPNGSGSGTLTATDAASNAATVTIAH